MNLFWVTFKPSGFIFEKNIWSRIINQFQHLFQGKSQKSFFMLFAYNQQLGSEEQAGQAEWWPLAVYQAPAQAARRAHSSVKLNGIKKSADCEFWPRAEPGSAWPGRMMEECGSSSSGPVNSECEAFISSQTAGNIWTGSNPNQTKAFTTHPQPWPVMDTFANLD